MVQGDCNIQNNCVSSNGYPERYENDASCSITMKSDASITLGKDFEIEDGFDFLKIAEIPVRERSIIQELIYSGQKIEWESDDMVTYKGWEICFTTYVEPGNYKMFLSKLNR